MNVTVTAVDDGVATIGGETSGTGAEDTAITGTLSATDPDGLTDGSYFTVTGAPTHGTAVIDAATGAWTYTPAADYNGSDSFTVTVTDDQGFTTTQVIDVTVTPVADIAADTATTAEDTAVTTTVLGNDTFEGTPVVTAVTQGANGTVTINPDNTVTYTPKANFSGTDSYTYTVTSGGVTETATVNVTVTAVNDPPSGTDNVVLHNENSNYVFTANDFGFSDPVEGNAFASVKITTLPDAGTLYRDADGDGVIDAGEALTAGAVVSKADIDAGRLKFFDGSSLTGGRTSFTFQVQDNGGTANGGQDTDPTSNTMDIVVYHPSQIQWLHNENAGQSDYATYKDPAFGDYFSSTANVSFGSGLDENSSNNPYRDFAYTYMLRGATATNYNEAKSGNDYAQVSFTTKDTMYLDKLWFGFFTRDASLPNYHAGNFKMAIEMSIDSAFSTYTTLSQNLQVGNMLAPNGYVTVNGYTGGLLLNANITYYFRIYYYDEQNSIDTVRLDDLYFDVKYLSGAQSGTEAANTLNGTADNDNFMGHGGNDVLNGGAGNDVLAGGIGNDTLTGGDGRDKFLFESELGSSNIDTITDFTPGSDQIVLENYIFKGFAQTGQLSASSFVANSNPVATTTNATILYNTTTGALYYDADGTGATGPVQFAVLGTTTHPTLSVADFVII